MANGRGVHQRRAELEVKSLHLAPKLKEMQSKASISKVSLPPNYFAEEVEDFIQRMAARQRFPKNHES